MSSFSFSHLRTFFFAHQVRAIGFTFFINSFLFGNWVTRIPSVKSNLGITESELGLALLFAPIGGVLLLPTAGWINKKLGLGPSIFWASLIHVLAPFVLSMATNWGLLAFGMFYFGLTNAWMDVAMNAGAAVVEKEIKKPIMSTCHGMWSLGAMAGSAAGSLVLWLDFTVPIHLRVASAVGILVVLLLRKPIQVIHESIDQESKVFAFPSSRLLLLAFIAFSIMLGEGAIADWSALYMEEVLHSPVFMVGLAFSAFALFMAIGRFSGDAIIPRFGMRRVVFFGSLLSSVALAVALIADDPWLALVGFGFTGFGFSCIIPVIFSSAANEPGYSAGAGIASVTVIGYAGFLLGPPFIGFIAEAFSLTIGFGLVVILAILAALLSLRIRFK